MPRPKKTRYITTEPASRILIPGDLDEANDEIQLAWDEYEALRLVDYEGLFQDAAGELLGVSRQTVGRILTGARQKLISGFVNGASISIEGGDHEKMNHNYCDKCGYEWLTFEGSQPSKHCPDCGGTDITSVHDAMGPGRGRGERRRKWLSGTEPFGQGPGRGGGGAKRGQGGRGGRGGGGRKSGR